MKQILLMKGIQASGKTTYARSLCEAHPEEWVRVNRDDIREMLGTYWVPKREDYVTSVENDMVETAIRAGYNVVIDATNLNKRDLDRWNKIKAKLQKDNITVLITEKVMKVSLTKALWRNVVGFILGDRIYVPVKVIKRFYKKYYEYIKPA